MSLTSAFGNLNLLTTKLVSNFNFFSAGCTLTGTILIFLLFLFLMDKDGSFAEKRKSDILDFKYTDKCIHV